MRFLLLLLGAAACTHDEEPVQFMNVRVEDVGAYRAVIRFETSRETTCHVEFGRAPDVLDGSATDPDMEPGTYLVTHEVALEDLPPETTFHFVAVATDPNEVEFRSEPRQLTTGPGVPVDTLTNVALMQAGTMVTAVSSNYAAGGNASSWGANNVIDGQMVTEWSSNMDGDSAFVELDLGSSRDVRFVGFRSRKMSDGTSIVKKFELRVDGQSTFGPFDTPDPDVRYVIELPATTTMRTVRMTALETTGGNTGLKELQLFAP